MYALESLGIVELASQRRLELEELEARHREASDSAYVKRIEEDYSKIDVSFLD